MPQVIFSPEAIQDLVRLRRFLEPESPVAAEQAAKTIIESLQALRQNPHIGRPVDELPEEYRDWIIEFGRSGYIARYYIDGNMVIVLAVRHQKEAGF
jgi:plasmid stabilization system protein ParE